MGKWLWSKILGKKDKKIQSMPFSCVESSQYLLYFMDSKMSKIKWDTIKHRNIREKFHSAQQDETP